MDCCQPQNMGCSWDVGCCKITEQEQIEKNNKITIDFVYLDLNVCDRCHGTDEVLGEAIEDVAKVQELTGAEIVVNKIHINNKEKATQHKVLTSPTIRVNGRDIQMKFKESLCESCGDLCDDEVDCRVWIYKGKEYTVPPKAMIVDAILREVYADKKLLLMMKLINNHITCQRTCKSFLH